MSLGVVARILTSVPYNGTVDRLVCVQSSQACEVCQPIINVPNRLRSNKYGLFYAYVARTLFLSEGRAEQRQSSRSAQAGEKKMSFVY